MFLCYLPYSVTCHASLLLSTHVCPRLARLGQSSAADGFQLVSPTLIPSLRNQTFMEARALSPSAIWRVLSRLGLPSGSWPPGLLMNGPEVRSGVVRGFTR